MNKLPVEVLENISGYLSVPWQVMLDKSGVTGRKIRIEGERDLPGSLSSLEVALVFYHDLRSKPRLVELAACGGSIPFVQWAISRAKSKDEIFGGALNAAHFGHLPLLKWIYPQLKQIDYVVSKPHLCFHAGYSGNRYLVEWVLDQIAPYQPEEILQVCKGALRSGNVSLASDFVLGLTCRHVASLYLDTIYWGPWISLEWFNTKPIPYVSLPTDMHTSAVYWLCSRGHAGAIDLSSLLKNERYREALHVLRNSRVRTQAEVFLVRRNFLNLEWCREMIRMGYIPGVEALSNAVAEESLDHLSLFLRSTPQLSKLALYKIVNAGWLEGFQYMLPRCPEPLDKNMTVSIHKNRKLREWIENQGYIRFYS